jgi:hypothetical protein
MCSHPSKQYASICADHKWCVNGGMQYFIGIVWQKSKCFEVTKQKTRTKTLIKTIS